MLRVLGSYAASLALLLLLSYLIAEGADRSTLIVGGDQNFPPFEYIEDGEPAGYNIDLIRAVAEAKDLDIEIRLGPWSQVRRHLEEGKIDIVTGMVPSEKRSRILDFSVPHTMISPGLFVRNDSSIREFSDISGKEILVEAGDIMHDFLREKSYTPNIIPVSNLSDALRLLSSGKHDGALLSSEMHKYYISGNLGFDNLREVKTGLPPLNYCFALSKGSEPLRYKLDDGLIILKSTGEYQRIYNKWFSPYENKRWWDTIKYFLAALVVIALFFLVSLLWSWSLKKKVESRTAELRENEALLRRAHDELEHRVEMRTADLALANEKLKAEILERERVENALRESEEKHRAIVEAFDGQIYICSSDNRIEFMNKKLIERTGRNAVGELCYEMLHDRESVCPWCINEQVMRGETVRWEVQSPKDNRWYYVVNTPIYNADGSLSKQAMIQDITDRVEAEQEKQRLEVLNRRLQKVESLDRMAGAIAHHFNNKLHVIIGHLELALARLRNDDEAAHNLTNAVEAAEKAAEVSRLMLTYLGKVSGKKAPLDFVEICSQSLPLVQASMPGHIQFAANYSHHHLVIDGNRNQIQIILSNMLRNSWEAVGENGGSIELTVKKVAAESIPSVHRFPVNWQAENNRYACLEVKDTGCGIAGKDIEAAFDPFFSTKFTGRGLGLSVVLGLVQAHKGAATVESTPGEGSIFSVFFPLSSQQAEQQPEFTVNLPEAEAGGVILLVDDDNIVLSITREMLTSMGFNVVTAKDGAEAVELFRSQKDDIRLVLSDFAMPKMNGLEMLTSLRHERPDIPVILASGYSEAEVMDSEHPHKPDVFLEKPYGIDELTEAISYSFGVHMCERE